MKDRKQCLARSKRSLKQPTLALSLPSGSSLYNMEPSLALPVTIGVFLST